MKIFVPSATSYSLVSEKHPCGVFLFYDVLSVEVHKFRRELLCDMTYPFGWQPNYTIFADISIYDKLSISQIAEIVNGFSNDFVENIADVGTCRPPTVPVGSADKIKTA